MNVLELLLCSLSSGVSLCSFLCVTLSFCVLRIWLLCCYPSNRSCDVCLSPLGVTSFDLFHLSRLLGFSLVQLIGRCVQSCQDEVFHINPPWHTAVLFHCVSVVSVLRGLHHRSGFLSLLLVSCSSFSPFLPLPDPVPASHFMLSVHLLALLSLPPLPDRIYLILFVFE